MILNVVVNLDRSIVAKIVYVVFIVVPFGFVKSVGWVPIVPKIVNADSGVYYDDFVLFPRHQLFPLNEAATLVQSPTSV
jgi:hypothetical protein